MLSPYHPLQLALGLTVWFAWFAMKYGALVIACEMAPPQAELGAFTWINIALLFVTLAVAGLLLYWANNCWRAAQVGKDQETPSRLFIARLGAGLNLVGAIATLSLGGVILILPPCL